MVRTFFTILLLAVLVAGMPGQASAQTIGGSEPKQEVADPFGRISPRGTVDGYLKAIREDNSEKAAMFLDVRGLPKGQGPRRAQQLKLLLDDSGYFFSSDEISASPEGNTSDEMSADLEEVGALRVGQRDVQLVLQRIAAADGAYVWLFSRQTIADLPALHGTLREGFLDRMLPEDLKTLKVLTVPIGHWLAIVLIAALSAVVGLIVARLIMAMVNRLASSRLKDGRSLDVGSIIVPLGLVIAVTLYRQTVILVGVQVVARGATDWIAVTVLWLAIAALCLKLVDLVAEFLRSAFEPDQRHVSLAALILLRKTAKAAILAFLVVQVLEILGFDVTTAIAALGIGGLALALGAQKTVENLVGSVNVVADRPVEVGDFCQFGDTSGTVEDIGIRSTKIRTPGRSVVTVPNGVFASMQIENFAARDRFLFNTVLSLRCDTPPDEVRRIIDDIRHKLDEAGNVADGARVNLVALTRSSLDIEIFCHLLSADYAAFVEEREALLLFLLETVSKTGPVFAFPPKLLEMTSSGANR